MNADLNGSDLRRSNLYSKRLPSIIVLCVVGATIRAVVAYNGGIWPDEGFFLSIVNTPSWGEMISFLHFHESHPPLFYALMRLWIGVFGTSDWIALLLPILLSTLLIPVIYFVGASVFSPRVGLLSATLTTISAGLVEFGPQLRPYCLLPTLVLLSCYSLVRCVEAGSLRRCTGYSFWTVLLLYTHNWGWVVAAGQALAVLVILLRNPARCRQAVGWLL